MAPSVIRTNPATRLHTAQITDGDIRPVARGAVARCWADDDGENAEGAYAIFAEAW